MTDQFDNIPHSLRSLKQWAVAKGPQDKAPRSVASNGEVYANIQNPNDWVLFDEAVALARAKGWFPGMVLTNQDSNTIIDIDEPTKKGITDRETIDTIHEVGNEYVQAVDSYTEWSCSGTGLHIVTAHKVPSGHRKGCFEIYPNERFMIFTGNVYLDKPVNGNRDAVMLIYERLSSESRVSKDSGYDEPEKYSDQEVINMVCKNPLYAAIARGDTGPYWNNRGHEVDMSQSITDLVLLNRIAYFSRNRAQTARLFRQSGAFRSPSILAQQGKHKSKHYVERETKKAFDKMSPQIDLQDTALILQNALAKQKAQEIEIVETNDYEGHSNGRGVYTNPGGLLGMIADYFYDTSFKQVPEIALGTAITFLAGPCGRAYRIDGLGLNMYTIILASTSTGKSIVRKGPQFIRQAMTQRAIKNAMQARSLRKITSIDDFFGPKTASGQALYKEFANRKSFACFYDEMANTLKKMWSVNAKPDVEMEFDLYLNLYTESGAGGSLDELAYSDKEKSVGRVESPSFSWVGVTVPDRFYDVLNDKALTSGFLPRMLTIEYESGFIQKDNLNHSFGPSEELMTALEPLIENAAMINSAAELRPISIGMSVEARSIMNKWKERNRETMNSDRNEIKRAVWSRVGEKVLKLAGLVAVGYNIWQPQIERAHIEWAINICDYEAEKLMKRYATGEVGESVEPKQLEHMKRIIAKFVNSDFEKIANFGLNTAEHASGLIPRRFIQQNCNYALLSLSNVLCKRWLTTANYRK
jgi:hypothetical protein